MNSSSPSYQNQHRVASSSADRFNPLMERGNFGELNAACSPLSGAVRRRPFSKSRVIRPLGYFLSCFALLGLLSACGGGSDSTGANGSGGTPGGPTGAPTGKAAVLHCAPAA